MNFLQYFDEFHNEYNALSIMDRVFMFDYNICRSCGSSDTKIFDRTETLSFCSVNTKVSKEVDGSETLHCLECGEMFEDIQDDCYPATEFPLRHFHKLIFLMNKMSQLTPESASQILRIDERPVGFMMGILNQHFNRKMIEIVSHIKNITRKDLLQPYLNKNQIKNTKPDDKTP